MKLKQLTLEMQGFRIKRRIRLIGTDERWLGHGHNYPPIGTTGTAIARNGTELLVKFDGRSGPIALDEKLTEREQPL